MLELHASLTVERWSKFTLFEQLGNIGSEIGRASARERQGDVIQRDKALERALELFYLTIADPRWRMRLKELCRAREIVLDTFWGKREYNDTPEALEKYFNQFALAARWSC